MHTKICDILVVGAGPAGSSAACAAAAAGSRVVVVERRRTIGVPVRCAEYIPRALLGVLDLDRSYVVQPIRSMRTVLPDGTVKETMAPGLTIRRDMFDQALAKRAREQGAELITGTRVVGRDGEAVIIKGPDGQMSSIKAEVIIGADGPHSVVRRWMGIGRGHMIPALQVKARLSRPMECTEVHFRSDIYGGYGWGFPKDGEANVGLAIVGGSRWSRPLRQAMEVFFNALKRDGKVKGQAQRPIAGWIPVSPVSDAIKENMAIVGDAAGHTHPITGAGVPQAIICGSMLGRYASEAVKTHDLGLLRQYDQGWKDEFGDTLRLAPERRRLLETQWGRLDEIIRSCWVVFKEYYGRA